MAPRRTAVDERDDAAPSGMDALLADIGRCRRCIDAPLGPALPHEPRPVLRISATARVGIFGQAPGARVHASGIPFADPSGDRLRQWTGLEREAFYDASRIAIVPMGFCFPGQDTRGGDLPPRRECAPQWRHRVLAEMPGLELVLLVGAHAIRWHMPAWSSVALTGLVERHEEWLPTRRSRVPLEIEAPNCDGLPRYVPLPHPSWRNNAWLARNPWFEADLVPKMRKEISRLMER